MTLEKLKELIAADDGEALDVFFAKKYGLTEEEFRYILAPKDVKGEGFPSESFRTFRDDELSRFGEYRTKRLALEAWERMTSVV